MSSQHKRGVVRSGRSRRQRLAAGAVLASTTLLGTYLAAVRPQPTYASPHKGGAEQGQGLDPSGRAFATFDRPECQVTVDDSMQLADAILASRDDSVICVNGTITLEDQPLPSIDDTRLTLMGAPGGRDDSIVVNVDDSLLVGSILTGTFTTTDDTLTIADLGFRGGTAALVNNGSRGGAIHLDSASGQARLVVYNSDFSGNSTFPGFQGRGGAVYVIGSVEVTASSFTANESFSVGGAMQVTDGTLRLDSSVFADNRSGSGGAFAAYDGELSVTDSTFRSNEANAWAGGAFVVFPSGAGDVLIDGSTFTANEANLAGGAGYLGGNGRVIDSVFMQNRSGGYGGGLVSALWQQSISVDVRRVTFEDNDAQGPGGAIYVGGDDSLTASYLSVVDNTAVGDGGGIYAKGTAALSLANSYVGGNSAAQGGAIFGGSGHVSLEFSTIYDNSASSSAAAVAEGIQTSGRLSSVGSIVGNPQDDTVVAAGSVDDTYSVSTGTSAVFTGIGSQLVAPSALALGSRDGTGPGRQGRTPGPTSPLVTGAPGSGLSTGVTLDQLGVLRVGTWTIGSRQYVAPPPPPPVYPPAPPSNVTAVSGDRSAVVSWAAPSSSGSFPVSTYKATASPGGQSCLVVAPALTCTVTGLANGTPYTFTVQALSGAGWSPASAPSNVVRPGGDTPAPQPQPLPGPLAPGEALLQVNGVPDPNVTVGPNTSQDGLRVDGDGWTMALDGLGPDGKPLNLSPDGSLRLQNERDVVTEGTGFRPNSEIDLYIDPPVQTSGTSARATSQAIYVGTVRTDAAGDFSGTATLPEDIAPGEHVLQAVGYSPTAQTRAMSLGVVVEPSLVLDKGRRSANGRHDRIRTTGSSTGIEAGALLTPWIRYSGQTSFTKGKASIAVQSDGSFRWTRQIRANKGITAYVSYVDTKSNEVFWAKVR